MILMDNIMIRKPIYSPRENFPVKEVFISEFRQFRTQADVRVAGNQSECAGACSHPEAVLSIQSTVK